MKIASSVRTIAFLGDYLPRKCGIATFTSDLLGAVAGLDPKDRCFAVSVNDIDGCYEYPDVVRFQIEEQDLSSYRRAADFINTSDVDLVSLQHEFGIFGGPAGSHLLALLSELKAPIVTTLHTVLSKPNADQHRVMQELLTLSTRLVVMTERAQTILQEIYQAPPAKIDLIPHGIPDVPFVPSDYYKDQFGVAGRKVLLTFGLLSPNKGIEHALNALPDIVAEFPDVVYIVLGATHPHELRARGETVTPRVEPFGVALSYKAVLLEGLEVAFIVITFGSSTVTTACDRSCGISSAAIGAIIAGLLVILLGALVRAPLKHVPENTLKFIVGIMLTSFGTFWAGEGFRIEWPLADAFLLILVALYLVASFILVLWLREGKRRELSPVAVNTTTQEQEEVHP